MLRISENANPNYLATICRIEELNPIPDADRLVKTVINGYDLVISKDSKIGDLVVYFPVETAIDESFLGPNNLYELSECESNANFLEVMGIKDALQNEIVGSERYNELMSQAKSKCGFFNKYGRVRILKLRGQYSQGFIAGVQSLEIAYPELVGTDWGSLVGTKFDYVGNKKVCEKYIPLNVRKNDHNEGGQRKWRKSMKKLKRFDKLIPDQFVFHYDTTMLAEHMNELDPADHITATVKVHGTSVILSNVLCNKELTLWEKIKKFVGIKVNETEYGNIYSSRRVIKNRYINKNKGADFYEADVWGEVNKLYSPFLTEGMTVYGEIVGYVPGTSKFIQKDHDYGCKPGNFKFMPYRITTTDQYGNKYEWGVHEVIAWTEKLIAEHKELEKTTMVMKLLYSGPMYMMYQDIPVNDDWRKNVLAAMKADKDRFGMELDEPMCKNKVPREGIVIRVDKDKFARAWKLKSLRHYGLEAKENDSGVVNIEDEA